MRQMLQTLIPPLMLGCIAACSLSDEPIDMAATADDDYERGPNNGRMLREDDFAVELAIFEAGIPPEFRAWATSGGERVAPSAVDMSVTLERLGGRDEIAFVPIGDYLRGDQVVYEPHSFVVSVDAMHQGCSYRWQYDSIEGRTQISTEMAEAFGIASELAGPATLEETVVVYGSIVSDPDRIREVAARFDGAIQSVDVAPGEDVQRGQRLAIIESNESLQTYEITAPIAGTVIERSANAGEQTAGRRLFRIVDTSSVWAELAIFPGDRARVAVGQEVEITAATGGDPVVATISLVSPVVNPDQSVSARVTLENADANWAPGMYVTAAISVAEFEVPLAVRRRGLQSFRDFTVVYAQFGDEYEVRMLELGREDSEWVEVLGGLVPGTRYVTANSYVLKADVEKSGAAHDH